MSAMTLRKLVTGYAAQDPAIIDSLINRSGILQTALFEASSHGYKDVDKKVSELPSGSFISLGGSSTDTTVNDEIVETDLKLCRTFVSEPKELVDTYPGGKGDYFRYNSPIFIEGQGQTIAKQAVYGIDSTFGDVSGFRGFHQIAKDNGKVIQAGGSTGSRTTIFAVRWRPRVCTMIFNDKLMRNGQLIDFAFLANGQAISEVTNTTTGAKKIVYQGHYDSHLGLKVTDTENVAAYTQIQDADDDRPTADNLDLLLDYVDFDSPAGRTFIYANKLGRRLIRKLKDGKLELMAADNNYDRRVMAWNGIPILTEENIVSTETTVLD